MEVQATHHYRAVVKGIQSAGLQTGNKTRSPWQLWLVESMQGVFAQIAFNGAKAVNVLSLQLVLATSLLLLSGKLCRYRAQVQYVLLLWHLCICARVKSHAT